MEIDQLTRVGETFRGVAECLETLSTAEIELSDFELHEDDVLRGGKLRAHMTVAVSLLPPTLGHDITVRTNDVTISEDGSLHVPLSLAIPVDSRSDVESGRSTDAEMSVARGDGGRTRSPEKGPSPDAGRLREGSTSRHDPETNGAGTAEKAGPKPSRNGDGDISGPGTDAERKLDTDDAEPGSTEPAYRDPERLRSVYEQHDTFEEMTEALGVDVTAQTVRRHMISHDIHDPSSRELNGTGDATEPSESTDRSAGTKTGDTLDVDVELPVEVTVSALAEAIQDSRTIQETGRQLDLDRGVTRELLVELDLIDLVLGRIDAESPRDLSIEEIRRRIRGKPVEDISEPSPGEE